jgi:hypothetical protein
MPKRPSQRERFAALASQTVERVRNEPVIATNIVAAGISVVIGFGVDLSADLKAGIIGLVAGAATLFGRAQVIPVDKLVAGTVLASAPGEPVTVLPSGADTVMVLGPTPEPPPQMEEPQMPQEKRP